MSIIGIRAWISNYIQEKIVVITNPCHTLNTLRPIRNEQHFADDTFKRIFLHENVWILIETPLKFVPKAPINNIPALVKIMAWRRPGGKPLSEPMMVRLPTHICVFQPQWVNYPLTCEYQIITVQHSHIIVADALAPCITRTSAAMIL